MKSMLMLRAATALFSVGIGSACAGDVYGEAAPTPFTAMQSQVNSVSVDIPRRSPLFIIGRVEVRVWAPVAPSYNAEANRDLATRYIWGAG
jgi:hypothetical protein